MALSSGDDTTQLASPSSRKNAPVVAHVGDLIDIDPHSELIFETPPPDVVDTINECFEQFTSTVEKRSDVHQPSSDSDSGESLFITQSKTKAVRTERRLGSSKRPESVSDDSGNGRENEDTENERGSGGQRAECPKRRKSSIYISTRKTTFPFLSKSLRRQHLSSKKHQILENSEMGGFLKCIRKIEEGCVNTGRAISPSILESELSDNSEGDDHNSDHEVTKVDKTIFVPSYFKGNKQKWLPQSFLEMRIQGSLSDNNEEQLFNTKGKEKKRKTKSTKKSKASASIKKQSKSKVEAPKSRAAARTSSESSVDSLFMEQEKQHETHEVLASCSDSAHCRHRLTKQTVQCAENLDGDHLVVIEETQRNSLEAVTEAAVHMEHDDNASSPSLFTSKEKKKKKHKLKEQEEAESGADNVHSVEMDQFRESQTTEMPPKRTKKKRKDKERTKTAHVEDNSGTDILSNETSEAPETEQPEHIQTSEEITGLKSVRKKKKNGSEESQYESVDFALDVNSVSQFNNVTDRSTTLKTVEERPSDVLEHSEAELNDTKHKKKRKRSGLSVNNSSEFSSSDAQTQETVAAERKRKKKRNSDHITDVGGELTLESSDHTVPFEKSPSPMLKSLEAITKKTKRKKNKEMNESINHIPDDSAELETVQTTRTDSIIHHNNADRQANIIISLGDDSADIRKKKKKRKKDTENNITEISMSQNTDSPKRPEKQRQRCHDRAGCVQTECSANNFLHSHRKHDTYEENHLKEGSGARESSVSQIDDVMLHKSKKKRKRREESLSVLDS
ncbi:glutamic acid-rich protein-like [Sinocyclocheilus grahami]|uniref:Glutamic acid-rich protein-like n=1 Tax=Sinocyclocheilus grahami TaxID=75366 RepID=A0A672KFB4_SINGR|nr:PREDICTED: glutamic acid-rich protein-like [Sinocyclocheilus grahami]